MCFLYWFEEFTHNPIKVQICSAYQYTTYVTTL
ncbi:hypothetical protein [Enterococcus phage MDA2]|uniref:Uncharacterized protein n=1 Tax=Enterococcus phage MDA2 TaxID=2816459 RepID=A0AAE7RHI5_9CAUD|nr:hypothetical protein [Enterococcus phage MDA2]